MSTRGNHCGSVGFIYDVFICLSQSHKMAWPFLEPVNADEVPEYYDVITDSIGESSQKAVSCVKQTTSELLCYSVSKRGLALNLSYENEFDLHEIEPGGGTYFHVNGFAQTRFDTEVAEKRTRKWPVGANGKLRVNRDFK